MPRFDPHPERRAAVVSGASSGIGLATAIALADRGHPVALGARRTDLCEAAVAEIRERGGEACAIPLDLADPASVVAFCDEAIATLGAIEILISNAAHNQVGAVLDMTSEELEHVLKVNLEGTHRLVRELLPPMVDRQRGDVIVVTSDVVERPRPAMAAYVTSKWGLEGYVRSLQMELEGTGVRSTVLRPGPTLTGMGMDWDPDATVEVLEEWSRWGFTRHPNFMKPGAVAQAIVAAVEIPRGAHITTLELQPEAPIRAKEAP